jgi:hypothetical protein
LKKKKAYWSRDAPTSLTFNNGTLCPHCIYLTTNSDLCHLHHNMIGSYNRVEKCLMRLAFKGLNKSMSEVSGRVAVIGRTRSDINFGSSRSIFCLGVDK